MTTYSSALPYDASVLRPAPGTPSIYAGEEEWAAFRALQALALASKEEAAIPAADAETQRIYAMLTDPSNQGGGAGRGGQGGASFEESPAQAPTEAIGPTGDMLSALAASFAPPSTASSKAPAPLKSDGSKDIYGVNAAEGGNRVNKNTDLFGVKATQDASGRVTLTNVGVPAGSYGKPTPSVASLPTVSNDLHATINTLRGTTDPDVARGLLSNIRETAAQQIASIQGEAMKFAANKLGVPFLETQLREAELADRNDPQWYPGIGDSPATAKIRQALLVTRGSVDNEAKNYLQGNTTFASLNAALTNSVEEAERIEKLGDRRANLLDNLTLRSEIKKQEAVSKAEAFNAGATPEMKNRIIALNPSIAAAKDDSARSMAMVEAIERADSNPAMRDAINATDQDLPILAMEENPHATALVIAKETGRPGANKTRAQVEVELQKVASTIGPGMIDKILRNKYGVSYVDNKAAQAEKATMVAAGLNLEAKGKAMKRQQDLSMALELYRADATTRMMSDVSQWPVIDPDFHKAVEAARKVTQKTSIDEVLAEYMKITPSEGLLGRVQNIQAVALKEAEKYKGSLFGAPDSVLIQGEIAARLRSMNVWEKIRKAEMQASFPALGTIPLLGAMFSGALNEAAADPLIDPATGLLRK